MEKCSESTNKILTVKVRKTQTSRYPFDKVYLFKREILPLAQLLTPSNLTFPLKGETKKFLSTVPIDELVQTSMGRTRDSFAIAGSISAVPILKYPKPDGPQGPTSPPPELMRSGGLIAELITYLASDIEDDSWYQLIPILGTFRSDHVQRPSYLCSPRWSSRNASQWLTRVARKQISRGLKPSVNKTRIIPDSGELTVSGEKHSPPCLVCTRLMNHMSGECELGGKICLENMNFGNKSYFLEGLAISNKLQTSSIKEVMEWLSVKKETSNGI